MTRRQRPLNCYWALVHWFSTDLKRNREEVPNQISEKAFQWAGPVARCVFRPGKSRRFYFPNSVRERLTLASTFSCVYLKFGMNDVTLLCVVTAYLLISQPTISFHIFTGVILDENPTESLISTHSLSSLSSLWALNLTT